MTETVNPRKLEVLQHLQCAICLDQVHEARLCPSCSRIFCDKCIHSWITNKSTSCPNCRSSVEYSALVKGCSITQLQDAITKLLSAMDQVVCDKHENQHLSLFCYPCEMNVCVKCWFSGDHADHKERAVPLEEAYEHYMEGMKATLTWINGRKELVDETLEQVKENLSQLSLEKEAIEKVRTESDELISGKASPEAVMQILKTERAMAELRSKHKDQTESIRQDRRKEFMSEAIALEFRMANYDDAIENYGSCEANVVAPYGFEWKCKIEEEDDDMLLYLSLVQGKPSEYSVLCGNEPEKVHRFELDSDVKIGVYKPAVLPNVVDGAHALTVHVRQSYGDRFEQLQHYIARLEKENTEHVAFKAYLADWDKRMAPSSG